MCDRDHEPIPLTPAVSLVWCDDMFGGFIFADSSLDTGFIQETLARNEP